MNVGPDAGTGTAGLPADRSLRARLARGFAPAVEPVHRRYGTVRGLVRLLLSHVQVLSADFARVRNPDFAQVRRLVFVCQGNICRSCFADRYARQQGVPSASFGLATAGEVPAFPKAIIAAQGLGVDLSEHRATDVEDFTFEDGDLLLAMEIRQVRRLMGLVRKPGVQITLLGLWGRSKRPHIHDPHRLSQAYFDTCFRVMQDQVDGLIRRLGARQ